MDNALLKEWQNRLGPKLRSIPGVNGLEAGSSCLIIKLEKKCSTAEGLIMDVLEREGADAIPYKTEVVGRVVKI